MPCLNDRIIMQISAHKKQFDYNTTTPTCQDYI